MPRKSAAALATEVWRERNAPPRPEPPKHLSAGARRYWDAIVAERPPDYFDAPNQHLLAGFCCAADVADVVRAAMAKVDTSQLLTDRSVRARYNTLSVMAQRQSSLMAMLATKLRLLIPRLGTMPQMAWQRSGGRAPWSTVE